ncbi:hypothetical protein CA606_14805 [Caulobacter vibrioides]|uniref:Uncharacterized protein n=1 Tax=Caulobacter vibrioides TaxID=155892 RepID=A0A290MN33_CAUVI|nr:hypothetical protein CA606_14805 [Caulobacter vibrioides]
MGTLGRSLERRPERLGPHRRRGVAETCVIPAVAQRSAGTQGPLAPRFFTPWVPDKPCGLSGMTRLGAGLLTPPSPPRRST